MTQGTFLQEFAQPSAARAQATARRCTQQLHAVSKQHIAIHQSIIHPTTYRYMHTFIRGNGDQAVKGGRSGQLAIV